MTSFIEYCFLEPQDSLSSLCSPCIFPASAQKFFQGSPCWRMFRNKDLDTRYPHYFYSQQTELENICILIYTYTLIYISVTTIHISKNHEFILIPQIPMQDHRLHFPFSLFLKNFSPTMRHPAHDLQYI